MIPASNIRAALEAGGIKPQTVKKTRDETYGKRKYKAFGTVKSLAEHAADHKIRVTTVYYRLRKGWDIERALSEPVLTPTERSKKALEERRKTNPNLFTDFGKG